MNITPNFNYLDGYFKQKGLCLDAKWLRWCHDTIATKIGMVKYEGLEAFEGLTPDIIERALMFTNYLCIYKSNSLGLGIYKYIPNSEYDMYLKPRSVNIMTLSGVTTDINIPYEDIIPLRDNRLDIIPFIVISDYIERIIYLENKMKQVMEVNTLPVVFEAEAEQTRLLKQVCAKAELGEPFILADKKTKLSNSAKSFPIASPLKPMEIYDLMMKYVKMCYNDIGIDSVDEKAERMVTDELDAQNDYTAKKHQEMEECRVEAFDLCNKKYGTNVKVIFHDTDQSTMEEDTPEDKEDTPDDNRDLEA